MSSVPRISNLAPEAQQGQQRAILRVAQELDALVRDCRSRFGVMVSTDLARELFEDYTASIETRLRFASAVQKAAAKVADKTFAQILSERGSGMALFTTGGTGAGKTTSIRSTGQTAGLLANARIIYDSNFNSLGSAKAKVESAIASGSIAVSSSSTGIPSSLICKASCQGHCKKVAQYQSVPIYGCTEIR